MKMKKLGVIFGGMSTENEVSVQSAFSILHEFSGITMKELLDNIV